MTERQAEIAALIAQGIPVKQIGQQLEPPISEAGVRKHIERMAPNIPGSGKPLFKIATVASLRLPKAS